MIKTLHRLAFLFLISHFTFFISTAQWVSIPDTNFGTWLNANGYSACMQGNNSVGWQMDTSCPAVVGAIEIRCEYKNITDITGLQYFDTLQQVYCSGNALTFLPNLPKRLITLNCRSNELVVMPSLPTTLWYLDCGFNSLTNLPLLPNGLKYLKCDFNELTALPNLPNGLMELDCGYNQLNNIPFLPNTITGLGCTSNFLTGFPNMPNSLKWLDCTYNQVTNLPSLPSSLTDLFCSYNQITSLSSLPNGLQTLRCDNNRLASLPNLQNNLNLLWCHDNQLSALPILPTSLRVLICGNNPINNLPILPDSLVELYCWNNQLTNLPELPDSLYRLEIDSNPISCLPLLKRVVNLDFEWTNVMCLSNYGRVTNSTPLLSSLPLCDIFNTNGCEVLWNISGKTYYDGNNNCIKDGTDTAQRNVKVELRSNIGGTLLQQTLTGGEGFYSFDTDSFAVYDVSIDTTNTPFFVSCPANNLYHDTISAVDSLDYSRDFALRCKPGFDLTAYSIYAQEFRPARFTNVTIHAGDITNFYGVHCAAGISGAVTVTITGQVHYISPAGGALTPGSVSGNVLTYNIADFGNVNFSSDFNIIVQTDTTAAIGSQVCFTVSVSPVAGDYNPVNNTLIHCFTVTVSHDPNEKQVYPEGDIDANGDKWLTYTINFQNTGTDTAQHIYITDTLDSNVDASTFQLLAYSHQPLVQIKENAVRFNFPNINLVDSGTNEPLSHGYVQYKVKLKDNLAIGTQVNNTAFIYFDFNTSVVTNTTTNTITTITAVSPLSFGEGSGVRIYPNPANSSVTINVDERFIGSIATITDVTGRKMEAVQLITNQQSLITSELSNGVYFLTITSPAIGSITRKLVVSK